MTTTPACAASAATRPLPPAAACGRKIENPFDGRRIGMRSFLRWTLDAVTPLAEALGLARDLAPLQGLADGEPNTAERLRAEVRREMGRHTDVPLDVLCLVAERREQVVARDIERIAAELPTLGPEADGLRELWDRARDLRPPAAWRRHPLPPGGRRGGGDHLSR